MYLYLSLVERKVAEFYHNMERRCYLVWLKWIIFITLFRELLVSLGCVVWGSTKSLILDPAGSGHAPFRLDARHSQADLQGVPLQTLLLLEAGT